MFREGNGTPLQYSCLENPMDGGSWWAAVHGVATERLHFDALEKEMATQPVFLPGESQGWGSLVGCCLWGHTDLDTTEVAWQAGSIYVNSNLLICLPKFPLWQLCLISKSLSLFLFCK